MDQPAPSKWLTLIAACLGLGMLMIDTFVVNVALPAIARDLDSPISAVQWTVSGYVLVLGVLPLTMGRLGDIFGRRRVYLLGLVTFVAASGLCGLAQNIEQLIAYRVIQAAGAATMMPGTLSIVTNAFPPQQRGLAIGIWGGVSGLGLIAGPILGGLLVNGDEWRWIFLVNLPIGVLAVLMALRYVPESRDLSVPRVIDWGGLVLLSAGLTAIMLAVTRAHEDGWTSPLILGGFALGALVLVGFARYEKRVRVPLVDLGLFRNATFLAACAATFAFQVSVFGVLPYTSLFMQNLWEFSPLEAGVALVPSTVIVAALMPVSGILAQRLGSRLRLVIIGGSLSVLLASLLLILMDAGSTYANSFLPSFLLRGLGIGLFMSASSYAVVSSLPLAKSGLASGTLTSVRNIGTAVGVALLGSVYAGYVDAEVPARLDLANDAAVVQVQDEVEQFAPAADPAIAAATEGIVIDGYVRIMIWSTSIAAVAGTAAFFIRKRPELVEAQQPAAATGSAPPEPVGEPAGGG